MDKYKFQFKKNREICDNKYKLDWETFESELDLNFIIV
jgi:hypothetical protein